MRLRESYMEASAPLLSTVSPYEFCGVRACFRGSSTLWAIELFLLIPHNLPPVEVTVTLTVFIEIHIEIHIHMYIYMYMYIYVRVCKYMDINVYL